MKKLIIGFGDSNMYGYIPQTHGRYDKKTRWIGILSDILNKEYDVAEEGCNNRTGFYKNNDGHIQTGYLYIDECLKKYPSPDIFILAIGTNDLQRFYDFDTKIFKEGLNQYIKKIKEKNNNVRIIIIPPVKLNEDVLKGYFSLQFDENSIKNSVIIQDTYKKIAEENHTELFDINTIAAPSETDGLHYCAQSHKIIAEQLALKITKSPYSLSKN